MSVVRRTKGLPLADEGSWAYLIAPAEGPESADRLRDRVVDACEASGWPTVTRSLSEAAHESDPGDFFEDLRHAIEHADVVVALLGYPDRSLDAALAMAYGHRRPEFRTGLERLRQGAERYRVAIMCSEEDPATCHRRLLVSRVLLGEGWTVDHIRGDGRCETEAEPIDLAAGALFDDEESLWRSSLSVSRRRPQKISSAA